MSLPSTSTLRPACSANIEIEYGSSPVAQPGTQTRSGSALGGRLSKSALTMESWPGSRMNQV
jgi:hypothetical protein